MWPENIKICDPSKLTVACCKEILQLWRGRQEIGGAGHTFQFYFFIQDKELLPALYDLCQQAGTPPTNRRNVVGSVAPLVIAAPNGRMPTPPVRARLSPNDSRVVHPSSTRPSPELCPTPTSLTQTMIGSPDQPPDHPMDPNLPLVTPFLDDPESDPIVMKKGRRTAHVPSADYSTDLTTEDGAVKQCRGP